MLKKLFPLKLSKKNLTYSVYIFYCKINVFVVVNFVLGFNKKGEEKKTLVKKMASFASYATTHASTPGPKKERKIFKA